MIQKKNIIKVTAYALLTFCTVACTGNFDDINKDPFGVNKDELKRNGYDVGSAITGLQSFVIPTKLHLHQFVELHVGGAYSGYTTVTPVWTTKFSTYNPPQDWIKAPFNDIIAGLYPYYEELKAITEDPVVLALSDIIRVASMHRVTDNYGPIPYSKMGAAGSSGGEEDEDGMLSDVGSLTAPYDSQEDVYMKMFEELDAAIEMLTENILNETDIFSKFDRVYYGDTEKWIRFANSLKLRMAMRLSYVAPQIAKEKAEQAVSHPVGVITENKDNAYIHAAQNNMATQVNVWSDDRASSDIICYMNGYEDPRREKYFTTCPQYGTNPAGYYGLRNGSDVTDKDVAITYSNIIAADDDPMMWMNAAEVTFLRAEGALRKWDNMGGSAMDLYNRAIELSFEQHGVSGAENYYENDTRMPAGNTDYRGNSSYNISASSNITIKWVDDDLSFEENLERIIVQKWIANFPLGVESWAEFRRTGYPKLFPVLNNKSGGTVNTSRMIRRLTYPQTEYTENTENLYNAIELLGGPDNGGTYLWWDVKNR